MLKQEQEKSRLALRITKLRKALSMNQATLAKAVGVGQGTVSVWEKGTHRPTPDALVKLGALAPDSDKFFFLEEAGLPKEYFLGGMENKMPSEMVQAADAVVGKVMFAMSDRTGVPSGEVDALAVPLLTDAIAAGNPLTINEEDIATWVPVASAWLRRGAKVYAVRVQGDSMEPILQDGFTVILDVTRRDPKKLLNKMAAVRVRDGVTIKWLQSDGKHFMLVAQHVSPRHPTIVLGPDEDWSIVGEVILWIGRPPAPTRSPM